jgi:hypothetical protein
MTTFGPPSAAEIADMNMGIAVKLVDASVNANESPESAIPRLIELIISENRPDFSQLGSYVLTAFADRDLGLEEIPEYVEDNDETWIVEEDKPRVRIALAAASARAGNLVLAQQFLFKAKTLTRRPLSDQDLYRINQLSSFGLSLS